MISIESATTPHSFNSLLFLLLLLLLLSRPPGKLPTQRHAPICHLDCQNPITPIIPMSNDIQATQSMDTLYI